MSDIDKKNSKKFNSYFDNEEEEQQSELQNQEKTEEEDIVEKQKSIKTNKNKSKKKFVKFKESEIDEITKNSEKVIKSLLSINNNELKETNNLNTKNNNTLLIEKKKSDDFLFEVPKPKNLKKKNYEDFNFLTNKDPTIEYFENMEELMDANNEDDMEYQLLDFNDLKNYINSDEEALEYDYDLNGVHTESIETQNENLENLFKEDPQNYETLYKLIYLYKESKNKEKLKFYRNYTQAYFPISDDMWKEWINDELIEININDKNDQNTKNPNIFLQKLIIIDLYEKALRDFYCNKR